MNVRSLGMHYVPFYLCILLVWGGFLATDCHAKVDVTDKQSSLVISNELLELEIDRNGGRISRLVSKPANVDFTWWGPKQAKDQFEPGGGILELNYWDKGFSEFRTARFDWEVVERTPEKAIVAVHARGQAGEYADLEVRKVITVRENDPVVEVLWRFRDLNVGMGHSLTVMPALRAVLRAGTSDGKQTALNNTYFLPTKRGIVEIAFSPQTTPKEGMLSFDDIARAWIGVVGVNGAGAALLTDYRFLNAKKQASYQYIPQWPEIYWGYQPLSVQSLQTVDIPYNLFLFSGVPRVDGVTTEMVGGIQWLADESGVGKTWPFSVTVFRRRAQRMTMEAEVRRLPQSEWQKIGVLQSPIPAQQARTLRLGFTPKEEGTHLVRVTISDASEKKLMQMERPIVVGRESASYVMEPEAAPVKMLALTPVKLSGPASPHIKWAKPSATGKIKALFVAPAVWTRELIELQQRMDLDFDVVTTGVEMDRPNYIGLAPQKEIVLREDDIELWRHLLTSSAYDVLYVRGVPYTSVPPDLQELIIGKVAAGMGLVYTDEKTPTPSKNTALQTRLLTDLKPQSFCLIDIEPARDLALQYAKVGQHGHGRIVSGGRPDADLCPNDHMFHTKYSFAYWEYWYANWIKVFRWAARRDPEIVVTGMSGDLKSPQLTVVSRGKEPQKTMVEFVLLDVYDSELLRKSLPPATVTSAKQTIPLPVGDVERHGVVRLHVFVRNEKNQIIDFGAASFAREGSVAKAEVVASKSAYKQDEPLALTGTFECTSDAHLKVEWQLIDAYERRFLSRRVPFACKAGKNTIEATLDHSHRVGNYICARMLLWQDNHLLNEARCEVMVQLPRPRGRGEWITDLMPGAIGIEMAEQPDYLRLFYNRQKRRMGIALSGWGGWGWTEKLIARAGLSAFIMNAGAVKSNTIGQDIGGHIRNFCFNNPEHLASLEEPIRSLVAKYRDYNPPWYGLADEPGIIYATSPNRVDLCYCEHCIKAFREHLQQNYPDIATLNQQWDTAFASFDEVMPLRADQLQNRTNLGPWLSFRRFEARKFAEMFGKIEQMVREADGDPTVCGTANLHGEDAWTGTASADFAEQISGVTSYAYIFPRARSFFALEGKPQAIRSAWTGYGMNCIPDDLWHLVLWGGAFPMLFYHTAEDPYGRSGADGRYGSMAGYFDGGGNPGKNCRIAVDLLSEFAKGLGTALITSEIPQAHTAVLFSYEDLWAEQLAKNKDGSGYAGYGGQPTHSSITARAVQEIQDRGLTCDYISPRQIEKGYASRYKTLLLPTIRYLSDKALQELGRYLDKGGQIVPVYLKESDFAVCTQDGGKRTDLTQHDHLMKKITTAAASTMVYPQADVEVRGEDKRKFAEGFLIVPHVRGEITYYGILREYWASPATGDDFEISVNRKGNVYDVRQHEHLGEGPLKLTRTIKKQDAVILAVLPYKVQGLNLKAEYRKSENAIQYQVSVKGTGRAKVQDHVVHLEILGPDGMRMEAYSRNLVTKSGVASGWIPVALNDLRGRWTVVAREAILGEKKMLSCLIR